jgi:hypothetical protein
MFFHDMSLSNNFEKIDERWGLPSGAGFGRQLDWGCAGDKRPSPRAGHYGRRMGGSLYAAT